MKTLITNQHLPWKFDIKVRDGVTEQVVIHKDSDFNSVVDRFAKKHKIDLIKKKKLLKKITAAYKSQNIK